LKESYYSTTKSYTKIPFLCTHKFKPELSVEYINIVMSASLFLKLNSLECVDTALNFHISEGLIGILRFKHFSINNIQVKLSNGIFDHC